MTAERTQDGRSVIVMMLPNSSRPGGNPFVGLLVASLDADIATVPFSWKRALTGQFDVFHAHWPEYLLHSRRTVARALRMVALLLVVVRCRVLRRRITVTVHNKAAHDGATGLTAQVFRWFVNAADRRVFLNSFDQGQPYFHEGDLVIAHGDYSAVVDDFESLHAVRREKARAMVFGSLRAYKGIESLLDVASEMPEVTFDVTGRPSDEAYAEMLATRARGLPNVDLNVGEVSDEQLAVRIRRATLIVLPYPDLYNSGAALLALTLRRPLLLAAGSTAAELAAEFGSAWVQTYAAPLTAADVTAALDVAQGLVDESPGTLSPRREWRMVGRQYSELFRGDYAEGSALP